ncbi:MAG: tyrosine-type recombinase/integrase [Cyanobacteria bacterium P01_E01_bin.6]
MRKSPSGSVSVQSLRGKLRLYWSHQGKRHYLYSGLTDNSVNRIVCEGKAKIIEVDLATGHFDPTLEKYKGERRSPSKTSVVELMNRFIEWKTPQVYERTLEKYRGLRNAVADYFGGKSASAIAQSDAERFRQWLSEEKELKPITLKERISILKACWKWGQQQKIVSENPWEDVKVKVPVQRRPKPMSPEEVRAILKVLRSSRYYAYYADFVEMLFSTGCRTSEVIGMRVRDLNDDCTQVWVGESLSRKVRKETKTNQARTIHLTHRLTQMIKARIYEASPDDLIFPAAEGGPIDDHNFRNRAWTTCLKDAGVEYRKPYITRSTFISNALAVGMHPTTVALMTGHDIKTLYENYAGSIEGEPQLPDLF